MSDILTQLLGQLSGGSLDPLSNKVGASQSSTQAAIGAALPMLLGALARNASDTDGAASLHRALAEDHDGSVLDDLGGFFSADGRSDGDGILKHAFGDRREAVEMGVAQASGLDIKKVGPLLAMLAPVVMGMLGKQQRKGQLDAGGLADMLGQERRATERQAPSLKGLGALLDRDGDGQVADDLLGGIGKDLLGSFLGGRR